VNRNVINHQILKKDIMKTSSSLTRGYVNPIAKAIWLLVFIFTSNCIYAQKELPTIDKIQLSPNYQNLERLAPESLKKKLSTLRREGVKKKWTFQVGVTSVADLSIQQIAGGILPIAKNSPPGGGGDVLQTGRGTGINPNARVFDLRTIGLVTPIRTQLGCGSCWAFASIASVESAHILKNDANVNTLDLSEQQILNCSGAGNCPDGGVSSKVLDYLKGTPATTEAALPYSGTKGACMLSSQASYKVQNWGWVGGVAKPSIQAIKNAIVTYGGVSSWVWVNESFRLYTGGVLNDDTRNEKTKREGGHFVQIIGWDDDSHAWIIKNSWGANNWGNDGFGLIDYSVLGIGTHVTWTVAATLTPKNVLFYNLVNGAATMTESNSFGTVSTHNFSRWFNIVDLGGGKILFYNPDGVNTVTNNTNFGTIKQYNFAPDWTHILRVGLTKVLFYNQSNGANALTDRNRDFATIKQFSFSRGWTKIVELEKGIVLFYNQTNGQCVIGSISIEGDFSTLKTTTLDIMWTHVTYLGTNRIIFYNTVSGKGLLTDANLNKIKDLPFSAGWTSIVPMNDNRILFYNQDTGVNTLTDENFNNVTQFPFSSKWSNIVPIQN
jgi:cathepsin L